MLGEAVCGNPYLDCGRSEISVRETAGKAERSGPEPPGGGGEAEPALVAFAFQMAVFGAPVPAGLAVTRLTDMPRFADRDAQPERRDSRPLAVRTRSRDSKQA